MGFIKHMGLVGSLWMACLGFSQTGPAGVGPTDGSSNLVLWLHADIETGTSGSVLSTWNDRSGYGHHFTAGNGAVFQAASQNGYAAFAFNGSSHYFQRAFTAALTPSTFSIFSATNVTSSNRYKAVISNRDDPLVRPRPVLSCIPGLPTTSGSFGQGGRQAHGRLLRAMFQQWAVGRGKPCCMPVGATGNGSLSIPI